MADAEFQWGCGGEACFFPVFPSTANLRRGTNSFMLAGIQQGMSPFGKGLLRGGVNAFCLAGVLQEKRDSAHPLGHTAAAVWSCVFGSEV